MQYTQHFSDTYDEKIMNGSNDDKIRSKMKIVLTELEKARTFFDVPFTITSGYRTSEQKLSKIFGYVFFNFVFVICFNGSNCRYNYKGGIKNKASFTRGIYTICGICRS